MKTLETLGLFYIVLIIDNFNHISEPFRTTIAVILGFVLSNVLLYFYLVFCVPHIVILDDCGYSGDRYYNTGHCFNESFRCVEACRLVNLSCVKPNGSNPVCSGGVVANEEYLLRNAVFPYPNRCWYQLIHPEPSLCNTYEGTGIKTFCNNLDNITINNKRLGLVECFGYDAGGNVIYADKEQDPRKNQIYTK